MSEIKMNLNHIKGIHKWNKDAGLSVSFDRSKEIDGPKFWRFKKPFDNEGTHKLLCVEMDKCLSIHNVDFASPVNGRDFIIRTIQKTNNMKKKFGSGKDTYTEVAIIESKE